MEQFFSQKLLNYIKLSIDDKTEEELEIIKYGIEIILFNINKTVIVLAIAYFLGIFKYSVFTLIIFAILRSFASGIHAKNFLTCLIITLFLILGGTYISLIFQLTITMKILVFIPMLYIYYRYSPADTENKPYLNPLVRKQLKLKSLFTICIYFILSIFIENIFFSNIFIHVIWIEALLINPITYKIFKRRYRNYEHYEQNL